MLFRSCQGSWLPLDMFERVALKLESYKLRESKRSQREHSNKPPMSNLKELAYIYQKRYHKLCGSVHTRLDVCDHTPSHHSCGRKHGYAKECDGSWMAVARFETLALRWPSTLAYKKQMGIKSRREERASDWKRKTSSSKVKESDKLRSICMRWNLDGDCDTRHEADGLVHRCSYVDIDNKHGDRICWAKHKEIDHKVIEYRSSRSRSPRRSSSRTSLPRY